ncbi:MAG: hypothetical protein AAGA99_09175 [Actinomycetota bacterium]
MTAPTDATEEQEGSAPPSVRIGGHDVAVDSLPWWRRPRRLRRQLVTALVLVGLLSVIVVGALNLVAARQLVDEGTRQNLTAIGQARARSVEVGLERLLAQASVLASDQSVVDALDRFRSAYAELDEVELDPADLAVLDTFYSVIVPQAAAGTGFELTDADDLRPTSTAGQYLQRFYTLNAAGDDGGEGSGLDDAGDGSTWSQVHAQLHPTIRSSVETLGYGDLLLVDADTDEVVYSTDKQIDLGTDLADGPYADSALAQVIRDVLPRVQVGSTVVVDQLTYAPAGGAPVVFLVTSVRRESEVLGTLVLELPQVAIDAVTGADGRWDELGLAEGESYLVRSDLVLRSESRRWLEDPGRYLDAVDDPTLRTQIEGLGTPAGLDIIDTAPVRAAVEGREFAGTSRNRLGDRTFTYATAVDAPGVDWIVVVDRPLSDVRSPLQSFLVRLGVILVIVLPVAAFVGYLLAVRLTRPVEPVVAAARDVASGGPRPSLVSDARDEIADVAQGLLRVADDISAEEAAIADERRVNRQLALTRLPERAVADDGTIIGAETVAEDVVVVVAEIVHVDRGGGAAAEDDAAMALGVAGRLREVVTELDLDLLSTGVDRMVVVAGARADRTAPLAFVGATLAEVRRTGEESDTDIEVRVGVAAGVVSVAVLSGDVTTVAGWGDALGIAAGLAASASDGAVMVDPDAVERIDVTGWERGADAPVVGVLGVEPVELRPA